MNCSTITYTDENGDEKEIFVVDLLNAMKNQYIEVTAQIKTDGRVRYNSCRGCR